MKLQLLKSRWSNYEWQSNIRKLNFELMPISKQCTNAITSGLQVSIQVMLYIGRLAVHVPQGEQKSTHVIGPLLNFNKWTIHVRGIFPPSTYERLVSLSKAFLGKESYLVCVWGLVDILVVASCWYCNIVLANAWCDWKLKVLDVWCILFKIKRSGSNTILIFIFILILLHYFIYATFYHFWTNLEDTRHMF